MHPVRRLGWRVGAQQRGGVDEALQLRRLPEADRDAVDGEHRLDPADGRVRPALPCPH
jgi:hypothetical protein